MIRLSAFFLNFSKTSIPLSISLDVVNGRLVLLKVNNHRKFFVFEKTLGYV